ncbi:hypothetical protein AB6A40_000293 [Gnathostoma spinigerum]|uniref:MaoC-like domain-containing protein n=1 Tax=Gnathostoma spinigerum TaxID=75299 RepID=A0ABD6E649_9BILA
MDAQRAKSHGPVVSDVFDYTFKDVIGYALGVGAKASHDLHYLYENDANFSTFPTFVVGPAIRSNSVLSTWPGIEFDPTKVLHGEHYLKLFTTIPTDGRLRCEIRIADVLDKGSGALILSDVMVYNEETNKQIAFQQFGVFVVGAGNFGGKRSSQHYIPIVEPPRRPPDVVTEEKTTPEQAILYRLVGGDLNPLHIDAEFAQISGYQQPILHGLCTLAFSVRHVLRSFAGNDPSNFISVKVRFAASVIPGQTLLTEMWKEGNRICFQTKVKETKEIVLSNAYVELRSPKSEGAGSADVFDNKSHLEISTKSGRNAKLISKL